MISRSSLPSLSILTNRWPPTSIKSRSKPNCSPSIQRKPSRIFTNIRPFSWISNGCEVVAPSRSNSQSRMVDPHRVNPRTNRRESWCLKISRAYLTMSSQVLSKRSLPADLSSKATSTSRHEAICCFVDIPLPSSANLATHRSGFRFTEPGMGALGDATKRRWPGGLMLASSRNFLNVLTYSSIDRWTPFSLQPSQPRQPPPVLYKGLSPSQHLLKAAIAASPACGICARNVVMKSGWSSSRLELSSHLSAFRTSPTASDVF